MSGEAGFSAKRMSAEEAEETACVSRVLRVQFGKAWQSFLLGVSSHAASVYGSSVSSAKRRPRLSIRPLLPKGWAAYDGTIYGRTAKIGR